MSNVNESCGCDTNYFSVINNSPLLSGDQENDFNPSFVNDINNSFSSNNISDNNIEMNSINNNAMNNAMNGLNNNGNNNGNNNAMNNGNNGNNNGTTQVISQPNINNLGRNNSNLEAIDYGSMRNMNAMNNQNAVNFNNLDNDLVEESGMKRLLTYLSFALVVIVALAWNDVAKFYINRSIKFQGGNHRYYVYYAVIATMLVAVAVKGVSKIN